MQETKIYIRARQLTIVNYWTATRSYGRLTRLGEEKYGKNL